MRYAIVIERTGANYGAYVLDLPGCVATGDTVKEVERNIRSAIEMHLAEMREDGQPIPPPATQIEYVNLAMTLSKKQTPARKKGRDLGEELLQAVRDVKAGNYGARYDIEVLRDVTTGA